MTDARDNLSIAEKLAKLNPKDRERVILDLTDEQREDALGNWRFWARPKQLPPEGDWSTWYLRMGRGGGKTRAGSGWVTERAMEEPRWIALIARSMADARDVMIEGPSGLIRNSPKEWKPNYEPSKRRITWPNGSWATIYSDEEPEQLRGFSGDTAWVDELGKYRHPREVWDNLQFGMRECSRDRPRTLISTTPRPEKILREIENKQSTIVVVGSSYENKANLDPTWFRETIEAYEGTRFGRQEIHAEVLEDVPGALWTRRNLDENRVKDTPGMARVVVGVDPAITSGLSSNDTGIVVVGLGDDGHCYVLDDMTVKGSPDKWARTVVAAYRKWEADRVVAECNQGGEMVKNTLHMVDPSLPVELVRATRGKYVRAEPISALYEAGRIHHYGVFPKLEDQMIGFTPEAAAARSTGEHFDIVDALVWGLSYLTPSLGLRKESMAEDGSPFRRAREDEMAPNPITGY